jgi:hypothetical protein
MNFYLQSVLILSYFLTLYLNLKDKTCIQTKLKKFFLLVMNIIAILYVIAYPFDFINEITKLFQWYDYLLYAITTLIYVVAIFKYIVNTNRKQ